MAQPNNSKKTKWGPTIVNRRTIEVKDGNRVVGYIRIGNRGEFAQAEVISHARIPENITALYGRQAYDAGGETIGIAWICEELRKFELQVEFDLKDEAMQSAEKVFERRDAMTDIPKDLLEEVNAVDKMLVTACGHDDTLLEHSAAIHDISRKYSRLLDRCAKK